MRNYGSHGGGVYRRGSIEREAGKLQRGMRLGLALLTITGFVGLSVSCSGDTSARALTVGHDGLPAVAQAPSAGVITAGAKLAARQGDFALYILPESAQLAQQAGRISLSVAEQDGEIVVTANVNGAVDLRGICAELAYPRARYSPVTARCGALLGSAEEQVSLCVTDTPGVAALGAVLKNYPQRTGMSGAGELAQVRFARHAYAGARRVSRAPTADEAKARLIIDCSQQHAQWEHLLPGDYDQNGQVGLGDLAPLAMNWNSAAPTEMYAFPDPRAKLFQWNALSMVDGNHDGIINLGDLAFLGMQWGQAARAYNIYSSLDPAADMPGANDGPDKAPALASASITSALTDAATGRRYFSVALSAPEVNRAYWVRATDLATLGTPSNYSRYCIDGVGGIAVSVEPVTAIGGGSATYEHTIWTYIEQINVEYYIRDAVDLGGFLLESAFDPLTIDFLDAYNPVDDLVPVWNAGVESVERDGLVSICRAYCTVPEGESNPAAYTADYTHMLTHQFARQVQTGVGEVSAANHGFGYSYDFQPGTATVYNAGTGTLSWLYSVPGDYDQNGRVADDDFIPFAYHYGKRGPFSLDSALSIVDGTQDGAITNYELRPLAQYYGMRITGYNVYATLDSGLAPVDGGDWYAAPALAPIAHVAFSEAVGDPLVDRLKFSAAIGNQPSGTYLWVVPEYKSATGQVTGGEYTLVP